MVTDTRKSKYSKVNGLDANAVKWTDGFWKQIEEVTAKHMLPNLKRMFEEANISHVVENFRIAAGKKEGDFDGTVFGDGDFYKWMEAEIYSVNTDGEKDVISELEEYINLINAAQLEDGYISTKQIIESRKENRDTRHGDVNEFEVYNMGHLFTAACIYKRITGKDTFLLIAQRAADYLHKLYTEAEENGDVQTAVCPSHYMGLIELYRETKDEKYLDLAQKAIELRDSVKNGMDDNQDREPLKTHKKIVGHAVRATYLYAGVADLYIERGDVEYLKMLDSVWDNLVSTKIYITGGIGALYNGTSPYGNFFKDQKIHQAFGYEYQLPNITAYNETCASIGLVMWAYRMFLIKAEAKYFDLIERVMLNTNLAAVSLDGMKYFYENMLRRAKKLEYELVWPLTRSEYILSYCCPPNLARMIMEAKEYAYSVKDNDIYIGLYGENEAHFCLNDGVDFVLVQKTEYPYEGTIQFTTKSIITDGKISLHIRLPEWSENTAIIINGRKQNVSKVCGAEYYEISLDSVKDLNIIVELDMSVKYTISNGMVEENTGQIAIERGPLVYCVETVDADCEYLEDICLNTNMEFETKYIDIAGRKVLSLNTAADLLCREKFDRSKLYQPLKRIKRKTISIRFIPYFAWDNRGLGEMRIWFPFTLK